MNVYKHELRANLWPTIIWALSLASLQFTIAIIYQSFSHELEPLVKVLENYPEAALKALGIDRAALNGYNGFYSIMAVYVTLCGAIQGLIAGIGVISKEGARKTSDFLFSKPLSRQSILMQKYLAALMQMLFTAACFSAAALFSGFSFVENLDVRVAALNCGAFAMTQLFCLSIGFCVGCCTRRIKSPNAVGIGIGAFFFALMMVENLSESNSIAFLTPLSYLNPRFIAANRAFDLKYLIALILLTPAFACAGVMRYKTRDIHGA